MSRARREGPQQQLRGALDRLLRGVHHRQEIDLLVADAPLAESGEHLDFAHALAQQPDAADLELAEFRRHAKGVGESIRLDRPRHAVVRTSGELLRQHARRRQQPHQLEAVGIGGRRLERVVDGRHAGAAARHVGCAGRQGDAQDDDRYAPHGLRSAGRLRHGIRLRLSRATSGHPLGPRAAAPTPSSLART